MRLDKADTVNRIKELSNQGLTNAMIALRLGITHQTVAKHAGTRKSNQHEGSEPVTVYHIPSNSHKYKGLGE